MQKEPVCAGPVDPSEPNAVSQHTWLSGGGPRFRIARRNEKLKRTSLIPIMVPGCMSGGDMLKICFCECSAARGTAHSEPGRRARKDSARRNIPQTNESTGFRVDSVSLDMALWPWCVTAKPYHRTRSTIAFTPWKPFAHKMLHLMIKTVIA